MTFTIARAACLMAPPPLMGGCFTLDLAFRSSRVSAQPAMHLPPPDVIALPTAAGLLRASTGEESHAFTPSVTWLTLSDQSSLNAVRREWDALIDEADAAFFCAPDWIDTWRDTIAPKVRPRVLTGWNADGRLRAIWPLGLAIEGGGVARCRVLSPMGGRVVSGDRLDPVATNDAPASAEREALMIDALSRARALAEREADLFRFAELAAQGPVARALTDSSRADECLIRDRRTLPYVALPDSFDTYLAGLSYNRRGLIRRKERLAIQRHELKWRTNDEGVSIEAAIEAFMGLHGQRWRLAGQAGNFTNAAFATFIRRFTRITLKRGWLRLHRLCDGDRTLAAMLVFHRGRRAYYYQSGWDPAIAELSPGSLCLARAIRTAIDERLSVLDLLRGDEPYKRHWATGCDETLTALEAIGMRGRARLTVFSAKERFKRGLCRVAGEDAWSRLRSWMPTW